jgi:glycosyltransferase 2 family protein
VLRWALGLGIASLAIGILARGLDWETLVVALKEAAYEWIVVGVVVISATVITRASRWRMLLYEEGVDLWSAVSAILIGQVISAGLPVARSGDVARAVWIGRRENSPGVVHTLGSIVIEKIYDLMALCATGLLLLVIIPLPSWFVKSTWGLVLVIVAGVPALYFSIRWQTSLLALSGRILARFPEKVGRLVMPQLGQLMEALGKTRHPRASIGAALWTLVTWLLGGLANWLVMRAFGVPSIPAAIFLLATLMLGSSAVPTPGRLGIFEGITVVSLAQFGVDPGPALAIGLVLHLVVMGPPLVMAALLMGAHALGWLPNPAAPVKVDPPLQCSADLPG